MITPIWRVYDEQDEKALGKEDVFMVITDTIEEICAKYNTKEETLTTLSDIVDEKYDEIYEKFNTSIDGYIKKVQFFSLIMCVLEIYKPDLYEFEGISPPPKKNST